MFFSLLTRSCFAKFWHVLCNISLRTQDFTIGSIAMNKLLSAKEIAEYLGINEMTVYKYAKDGRLPAIRIGKLWRFDAAKIDKMLADKGERSVQVPLHVKNQVRR